jgi:hypothetical protein
VRSEEEERERERDREFVVRSRERAREGGDSERVLDPELESDRARRRGGDCDESLVLE